MIESQALRIGPPCLESSRTTEPLGILTLGVVATRSRGFAGKPVGLLAARRRSESVEGLLDGRDERINQWGLHATAWSRMTVVAAVTSPSSSRPAAATIPRRTRRSEPSEA
jgi:hypothetical protein